MKRGFTLVEILTVIGIIAVLAAILFPVLGMARKRSYRTACLSNISQIGKAIGAYATDYDDRPPFALSVDHHVRLKRGESVFGAEKDALVKNAPNVLQTLKPYGAIPAIWKCPSDVGGESGDRTNNRDSYFWGYGASYNYNDDAALFGAKPLSGLPSPATFPLLWDFNDRFHDGWRNMTLADLHTVSASPQQQVEFLANQDAP